jgi:hypothetical protein
MTFHPNRIANEPVYLYGAGYPGGRVINYDAFAVATDPTGNDIEVMQAEIPHAVLTRCKPT